MIKVEQAHLERMLASAQRIAASGPTQALSCVRLAYDGARLTVDATDMRIRLGIEWRNVVGAGPMWSALVDAKHILNAVQTMPTGKPVRLIPEVAAGSSEAHRLTVASGDREKEMSCLVGAGYPDPWEAPPLTNALTIPAGALCRLIEGTAWAASAMEVAAEKLWFTGVRFVWSPEHVTASATNGKVITSARVVGDGKTSGDLILPLRAAKAIGLAGKTEDDAVALQLANESPVRIATDGRHVRLDAGGAMLLASCLGQAIDLSEPRLGGPCVSVPRLPLLAALKAMRGHDLARVMLSEGTAIVTATSQSERATDKVHSAQGSAGFSAGFSIGQMVPTLARWDCETVSIHVDETMLVVLPEPHEGFGDMSRLGRLKGDETAGVTTIDAGPCDLCHGDGKMLSRANTSGTKIRMYSPRRTIHIDIVQIIGGKKELGDVEVKCPVCTDAPMPAGAVLRVAK